MPVCRKCGNNMATAHAFASEAATDGHPLALVIYQRCEHSEFVRHEHLFQGGTLA